MHRMNYMGLIISENFLDFIFEYIVGRTWPKNKVDDLRFYANGRNNYVQSPKSSRLVFN